VYTVECNIHFKDAIVQTLINHTCTTIYGTVKLGFVSLLLVWMPGIVRQKSVEHVVPINNS
jgi:hypothetical protein